MEISKPPRPSSSNIIDPANRIANLHRPIETAFVSVLLFVSVAAFVGASGAGKKNVAEAWSILRESLTVEDSVIREQAVQALEFIEGDAAVKSLESALKDESEYVRIWAARSLARKGNPAGKDTLLDILSDNGETAGKADGPLAALVKMKALARGRFRGEAAKVLGELKDPSVIPVLKNAQRDNDGRVRDGAAVALALLGDTTQGIVFASALKDPDKGVRLAAAEALEAMKDPRFVEPMLPLLSDADADVRNVAVSALGAMKAGGAAEALATALTDESGLVRESAARALGDVGAKEKMAALKASLSDPNLFVQIAAAEALGKLGDTSGVTVLEAALNSNDTDARAKAAATLAFFSDATAQGLAVKTLSDGHIRVRLGAAISVLRQDAPARR